MQIAEPLLEGKDTGKVSILLKRNNTSTACLAILWVASLALVSLSTFLFARAPSTHSFGSFTAGYTTELGESCTDARDPCIR